MFALRRLVAVAVFCLAAAGVMAQEPEVGELLVAGGSLDDPNFEETVLLIVHHGEDGTIGVALNRPTWVEPQTAFPDIALGGFMGSLYFGGPVAPSQPLIVFERGSRMPQGARHVVGSVYVSADPAQLLELELGGADAPRVRIFAGHATWAPGQLAREIAIGNWRTLPARAEQIFSEDAASLWDSLPLGGDAVTAALF
jgi:putative transcriptional regulator